MKVHTIRHVTQGEYLREFELRYGALKDQDRKPTGQRAPFAVLEEWRHLAARPERNSSRITINVEILFQDQDSYMRALTPQRLRLFEYLRDHPGVESLNELATRLRRNYRNVYSDAAKLAELHLILLDRRSNRVVPKVMVESLTITV